MHDAGAVGLVEGVRDLDAAVHRLVERQRPPREPSRERFTVEILQHQIAGWLTGASVVHRRAACRTGVVHRRARIGAARKRNRRPDVVERADVRVIQGRDRARLSLEPCAELRVVRDVVRKDLDGHRAVEPRVACLVDLPHATRAERRHDLVRSQPSAVTERHLSS